MITNFYNIPYIGCDKRLGIDGKTPEELTLVDKNDRCSGLNPDNVFGTLFPDREDPTINYDIISNRKITVGNSIGVESEKDAKQCARDCSSDSSCTYFTLEKGPNECRLYTTKEASKNDKFTELAKTNNIQTWRKNDLLDGTKNCNIQDGFILQDFDYFPTVDNANDNIKPTNIQKDLTKNECLASCLYNNNCNSVVFLESKSRCQKRASTRAEANSALQIPASINEDATTYLKKEARDFVTNRFGIKDDMLDYYKTYSTSGKVGDSFCQFVDNKCMTSYIVGPNNERQVPSINSQSTTNVQHQNFVCPQIVFLSYQKLD